MRNFWWIMILSSLQMYGQSAVIPYNSFGLWGFADTSGKVVVQPFSKYPLGIVSEGLSNVLESFDKVGVVDTNAKCILPNEFQYCEFHSTCIDAIKNIPFKTKEGVIQMERWHFLYNKKGVRIPIPAVLSLELLKDTNFIVLHRNDSSVLYRINWQQAQTQFVLAFKNRTRANYHYTSQGEAFKLFNIVLGTAYSEYEYFWPDGHVTTQEESDKLIEIEKQKEEMYLKRRDSIRKIHEKNESYEFLIHKRNKRYKLRSQKSRPKKYDGLSAVYACEDGPVIKYLIVKKSFTCRLIDTFGHQKFSITCDHMKGIYTLGRSNFTGFFIVHLSGKKGLCDTFGNFVLEPKYDELKLVFTEHNNIYSTGGIIVKMNDKWGFCDGSGKLVLDLKYEEIMGEPSAYLSESRPYIAGTLKVKLNGKWGLSDSLGNLLIDPQFDRIEMNLMPAKNRIWYCKKDGKYTVFNAAEKKIIGNSYDSVIYVNRKFFIVKKSNLWGVVDIEGKTVIDFQIQDLILNYTWLRVLTAGNDICLLGSMNNGKDNYFFSNIKNYEKLKLSNDICLENINFGTTSASLKLENGTLNIMQSRSKLIVLDWIGERKISGKSTVYIDGMEYYYIELDKLFGFYIREDGIQFFDK